MCQPKEIECQRPDQLKGKPGECTPEQIKFCHGEKEEKPFIPKSVCEKPEHLKNKPKACTEKQIKKCHGDDATHPCVH